MNKTLLVITTLVGLTSVSFGQQQTPDEQIQFLSRAVGVLQQQRNAAEDNAAQAAARAAGLQAELDALKQKDAAKDKPAAPASVNVVKPPESPKP